VVSTNAGPAIGNTPRIDATGPSSPNVFATVRAPPVVSDTVSVVPAASSSRPSTMAATATSGSTSRPSGVGGDQPRRRSSSAIDAPSRTYQRPRRSVENSSPATRPTSSPDPGSMNTRPASSDTPIRVTTLVPSSTRFRPGSVTGRAHSSSPVSTSIPTIERSSGCKRSIIATPSRTPRIRSEGVPRSNDNRQRSTPVTASTATTTPAPSAVALDRSRSARMVLEPSTKRRVRSVATSSSSSIDHRCSTSVGRRAGSAPANDPATSGLPATPDSAGAEMSSPPWTSDESTMTATAEPAMTAARSPMATTRPHRRRVAPVSSDTT